MSETLIGIQDIYKKTRKMKYRLIKRKSLNNKSTQVNFLNPKNLGDLGKNYLLQIIFSLD